MDRDPANPAVWFPLEANPVVLTTLAQVRVNIGHLLSIPSICIQYS